MTTKVFRAPDGIDELLKKVILAIQNRCTLLKKVNWDEAQWNRVKECNIISQKCLLGFFLDEIGRSLKGIMFWNDIELTETEQKV
jgi:hypothetical protein